MKRFEAEVTLTITFESPSQSDADYAIKTIIIDSKFSPYTRAKLISIEEEWNETVEKLDVSERRY